jgi:hypothetical protein
MGESGEVGVHGWLLLMGGSLGAGRPRGNRPKVGAKGDRLGCIPLHPP